MVTLLNWFSPDTGSELKTHHKVGGEMKGFLGATSILEPVPDDLDIDRGKNFLWENRIGKITWAPLHPANFSNRKRGKQEEIPQSDNIRKHSNWTLIFKLFKAFLYEIVAKWRVRSEMEHNGTLNNERRIGELEGGKG